MSCAFRALPRIIAEIILAAPRSSEIVIISPWIREVMLKPPVMGAAGHWNTRREMLLSEFLLFVVANRDVHLSVIVREIDRDINRIVAPIQSAYPSTISVYEEEFLHAKVIATNTTILQMSANLIPTSLYRNVENCSLSANKYQNARRYVLGELKIKL